MSENEVKIEVIIDLFSGLQNPKWFLTREKIEKLQEKLLGLPTSLPKKLPILGYRGVIISNLSKIAGIQENINIFNGVISVFGNGNVRYLRDINNIEEWILDQARELGFGIAIDKFRSYSLK